MRKGTNEKTSGEAEDRSLGVQSFQSFPFRDFLQNPPTSRQKGNPKADTRTHPEKKAQKTTTTTQFLKMENPKSSPRTQSPIYVVGKKQGTLAK